MVKKSCSEVNRLEMDRLWRPVFDKYDRNHSGVIECHELKRFLKASNYDLSEDIPMQDLDDLIDKSEYCSEGVMTFEEFLKMINDRNLCAQRPRLHRVIRYGAMAIVPHHS